MFSKVYTMWMRFATSARPSYEATPSYDVQVVQTFLIKREVFAELMILLNFIEFAITNTTIHDVDKIDKIFDLRTL